MTTAADDEVGGQVVSEVGPWAMVPVWVLAKGLKPASLVTYVALRSFADRGGDAHPRAETIAERANLAVGTVRNAIQELRAKGLIVTSERRRADGSLAGLVYKMFDIDPTPQQQVEPRRKGEKPGRKPGQKPSSDAGTPTNADPSTGEPTGTLGNADPLHYLMQQGALPNAGKNTPREHPTGTPSEPATQVRPAAAENAAQPDGQITIDGAVEPPSEPAPPTTTQIAFGIAGVWISWWNDKRAPVGGSNPKHQLKCLVKQFLDAGYSEKELQDALKTLNEPIPHKAQLQRELIRARGVSTGSLAHPRQRGAAADINSHWRGRETAQVASGGSNTALPEAPPRAAAIRTDDAFWEV